MEANQLFRNKKLRKRDGFRCDGHPNCRVQLVCVNIYKSPSQWIKEPHFRKKNEQQVHHKECKYYFAKVGPTINSSNRNLVIQVQNAPLLKKDKLPNWNLLEKLQNVDEQPLLSEEKRIYFGMAEAITRAGKKNKPYYIVTFLQQCTLDFAKDRPSFLLFDSEVKENPHLQKIVDYSKEQTPFLLFFHGKFVIRDKRGKLFIDIQKDDLNQIYIIGGKSHV